MKVFAYSILFLCLFGVSSLFAPCKNSEHAKARKIKGKTTKSYNCNFKTKAFYDRMGGKGAKQFYTGDTCKYCGCLSSEHEDRLSMVARSAGK